MAVALPLPLRRPGQRLPTLLALLALAALALRPELLLGGPLVNAGWHSHYSLLVLGLGANALLFGLRRRPNWPVLALLLAALLAGLLGRLAPAATLGDHAVGLVVLALPWLFVQVRLEPGSRTLYAATIAWAPAASVLLGLLLQLAGIRPVVSWHGYVAGFFRLQGAAGIAADLALLGFAGLAVALHEWLRLRRAWAGAAVVANLVIIILTGTRMALLASLVLLAGHAARSAALRARLRSGRLRVALTVLGLAFLAYLPSLYTRLFSGAGGSIGLSGRDELWTFHFAEFLASPWFGRGPGAGFVAGRAVLDYPLPLPHNEYLHLLVAGGIVGAGLCLAGLALWYLETRRLLEPRDRRYLAATLPALAVYALTENVLSLPSGLGLFVYVAVLAAANRRVGARLAEDRRMPTLRPG